MNNIIKVKHCPILWCVNDLKMLHVDSDVIYRVFSDIDAEYGNIANMTITRGEIQKYLGMTKDYFFPSKIKFSMDDYIGKIIDNLP